MTAALGMLEMGFIVLVGGMSAAAGVFALFVVFQLFRHPFRRR